MSAKREQSAHDIHVMPTYGREHTSDAECWCAPEPLSDTLDRTKYRGTVWMHKDMN